MTIPLYVFLAIWALLIITLLWAWDQMNARRALEDIISHSAQVCFICHRIELGHDQIIAEEIRDSIPHNFGQPNLDSYHDYMPAVLVYIPDPLLR